MIDISKKYRTRDGREVRIYALDGGGSHPVHGACKHPEAGGWVLSRWNEQGRISSPDFLGDLIEVKRRIKRTLWVNLFPVTAAAYLNKFDADSFAGFARLSCIKVEIDCEEGEGL